jgi:hypothetical protein
LAQSFDSKEDRIGNGILTSQNTTNKRLSGEVQPVAGWTDPDFDPLVTAFYYTRVIEIPTPRWPVFDEVRFGIKMGPEVKRVLQERAYTSLIWYSP